MPAIAAGGSLAGNDSADASSGPSGAERALGGAEMVTGAGIDAVTAAPNICFARSSGTRSCGRDGPARLGTTVARSSSTSSEYCGAGVDSSCHSACSFAYASTSATSSSGRPLKRR